MAEGCDRRDLAEASKVFTFSADGAMTVLAAVFFKVVGETDVVAVV